MVREEIVLIGPIGTGKSTVGKLLAKNLKLPQCSMDKYRWSYYQEIGYDPEKADEISNREGFSGLYKYWKKFEIYAVERLLQEHKDCVFDFGAGHSVYENEEYLTRAVAALNNFSNVILLLPSKNSLDSQRIINERNGIEEEQGEGINYHFITHKSNAMLAKHTVYTEKHTVEDVVNEILSLVETGNT